MSDDGDNDMTTPSLEEVVDPRIAVLIVWAIFFLVFIILPSVCIRCLGCCSNTGLEHDHRDLNDRRGMLGEGFDNDDDGFVAGWERYMFLTANKRQKIDELRCDGLRKYLGRYSIVLEEGHMLCLDENGEEIVAEEVVGMADTKSLSGEDEEVGNNSSEESKEEECCPQDPSSRDMASPDDCKKASPDDYIDSSKDEELQKEKEKEEEGDSEVEDAKVEETGMIDIMAPPGPLGIQLKGETGPVLCTVTFINENSPLATKLKVGDRIVTVDDLDVQHYPACAISLLLCCKSTSAERKITILRGDIKDYIENVETLDDGNGYTHVRIPFPGYDCDGIKVKEKPILPEGNNASWKFSFFQAKVEDETQPQEGEDVEEKEAEDTDDDIEAMLEIRTSDERRTIPHFCAICLGEYSKNETISWSSNSECSHVFHQQCIVKWLNTLGKKTAKYTRYPEDPDVLQLLNYRLACPCCRQDFISNLVLVEDDKDEGAEEECGVRGDDENV